MGSITTKQVKRLEEIGKPHIIGSYKMDMMAWNDLDIDIENDYKPYSWNISISDNGQSESIYIDILGYSVKEFGTIADPKERDVLLNDFLKRLEAVKNSECNGKITIYSYGLNDDNVIPCVYKIEGLPTVEQLEKEKEELELILQKL